MMSRGNSRLSRSLIQVCNWWGLPRLGIRICLCRCLIHREWRECVGAAEYECWLRVRWIGNLRMGSNFLSLIMSLFNLSLLKLLLFHFIFFYLTIMWNQSRVLHSHLLLLDLLLLICRCDKMQILFSSNVLPINILLKISHLLITKSQGWILNCWLLRFSLKVTSIHPLVLIV